MFDLCSDVTAYVRYLIKIHYYIFSESDSVLSLAVMITFLVYTTSSTLGKVDVCL